MLDKEQIQKIIPHRPPFLWIDRVTELETGVRCVSTKRLDSNEPVFAGHFPGNAVLPGVLIIEAAAQTAAVMFGNVWKLEKAALPDDAGAAIPLMAAVRSFKFLKPVRPGAELRIETTKIASLESMVSVKADVWVGDQEVARGELFLLCPG